MLHLAERNLLLKVFEERIQECDGKDYDGPDYEVRLVLSRRRWGWRSTESVLRMSHQQGDNTEELPRKFIRRYRIKLYGGWLILSVWVRRQEALSDAEGWFMKGLVADAAEVLKLFANGDAFMKVGVEKLVAKIAAETGMKDPTAWVREYLAPPQFMERPEVRRYYRLYNQHLNHAKPQCLLQRRAEELVETPV